jgi:magnesium transporter
MRGVIRGVGLYHRDGAVDGIDDSVRNIPADHNPAGEGARESLVRMRDQALELPGGFAWIGLLEPTKPELSMVAEIFALEPLQVEDAANPRKRPKVDFSEEGTFFTVLKTLGYDGEAGEAGQAGEVGEVGEVDIGQVAIFTGPGYVITVRHGKQGDLTAVRSRIRDSEVLRNHGPLSVLYAIMDMTVDGYLAVMDGVNEDVGEVEAAVFGGSTSPRVTQLTYELKRENMVVRRAVHPLFRVAHDFADEVLVAIPEELRPYFRKVGEHILRVSDGVESMDSQLMNILFASTSMRDLQQNADARKISAWVAIAAVPTVAGGIYGMNFEYMPELSWKWSYPVTLSVLTIICLLLYRGFKRNGWL